LVQQGNLKHSALMHCTEMYQAEYDGTVSWIWWRLGRKTLIGL